MSRTRWFVVIGLVLALALLSAGTALADAPRIPGKHGTSTNWSGYAALTDLTSPLKGSVSDVKGTWHVPSVSGSTGYSSAWVGIDGYSSSTVEQIGTEQDVGPNGPRYYAWYEMYPKRSYIIPSVPISAGDEVSAEVKWFGGKTFQLSITNLTTLKSFSAFINAGGNARRTSAEWIMEAPSSGGVLPLVEFAPITFTDCSATISGHTGPVNDSAWKNDPITMTTSSGTPLATPSGLSAGGTKFTVTRD